MRPKNIDARFTLGDRLSKTAAISRTMRVSTPAPPPNSPPNAGFLFMDPDHAIRRIAQEWQTLKLRLDSAHPGIRSTDGYLGGLVESQRCVLDATVQEAVSLLPSPDKS